MLVVCQQLLFYLNKLNGVLHVLLGGFLSFFEFKENGDVTLGLKITCAFQIVSLTD